MQQSIAVLSDIANECGLSVQFIQRGNAPQGETSLETFEERRRAIAGLVAEVLQLVKEQEAQVGRLDQKRAVQLSVEIRHRNRRIEELYVDLRHFYERFAAQCVKTGEDSCELAQLRASFHALEDSIKQMRLQVRQLRRFANESARLLGLADVAAPMLPASNDERIRDIEATDALLDEKMDALIGETAVVRDLADGIIARSEEQDVKISLLTESLDRQIARQARRDTSLQRRLRNVRGPDRMCFTVMLIFVILGVVVFFSMAWLN